MSQFANARRPASFFKHHLPAHRHRQSPGVIGLVLLGALLHLGPATPLRAANISLNASDALGASSFSAAGHWSNASAPSAGNNYFTGSYVLRIPADTVSRKFAGDSLTLNTGGRVLGKTTGSTQVITANSLILNGGNFEQATAANDNHVLTWAGDINVIALSGIGALGGANGSSAFETLDLTARINGTGDLQLGGPSLNAGADSGVVCLSAANPYAGNLMVSNAVIASTVNRLLQLNNKDALSNATLTLNSLVANPVSFASAANTGPFNVGALAGASSQVLADTAGAAITLNVGAKNFSSVFSGRLSGPGSLLKTGTGTLTLSGYNTYTGGTSVADGTLQVVRPFGSYSGAGTVAMMASSALLPQTVSGGAIPFAGNWIVAGGWLAGTNEAFGTNSIVVDAKYPLHSSAGNPQLAGVAVLEPLYDLNSAGTLTLTNGGKMILRQNCAFPAVLIEGAALSAGTHSFQELMASFPNNFVSGGAGYITVQPFGTLPPPPPQAPIFLTQPVSQTNFTGMTVKFRASIYGNPAPSFQWKAGAPGSGVYTNLANNAQFSGVNASTLTIAGLTLANTADYVLVASNASGAVTSAPASLTVMAGSATITNEVGLRLAMSPNGTYTITSVNPAWTFTGDLGQVPANLVKVSDADAIGGYIEFRFDYSASVTHSAAIRLYTNQPVVLFADTGLGASPNDLDFPHLTSYPGNLYHFSYVSDQFAPPTFSSLPAESPWVFFDTNYDAFILSSGTNYLVASNLKNGDGSISCGINSAITELPAGFTHRTLLTINTGINRAFDTWGNALTGLSGKVRPANDAAVELDKLGYWTDNGASYYYNYVGNLGYIGTLLAARDEFAAKGVPIGYLQLDSWWYPKGTANTWQGDSSNNRCGLDLYQAESTLFPNGLADFQRQLGLPLFTHCRWVDAASPYREQYAMSRNVIVDWRYWTDIMAYLKDGGVKTFEQDWMNQNALPAMNLDDPPAFMNDMAAAAASNGLNLQYCMQLPRHFLQSSLYNNLLTMRVSTDRFDHSKWPNFLYSSRLAGAVGAWPWVDVYPSSEARSLLLDTLSAGPVGVGDALGAVNTNNLFKVVRLDGVIVKPDVPLVPLDQNYLNDAQGLSSPLVAGTFVDHHGLRALYVYSYARNAASTTASFTPGELGLNGTVYVYDYFNQTGLVVSADGPYHFSTTTADNNTGGTFHVVVPVGPSGIALLGDTNKFVTLGKKRVSDLADQGVIKATVRFATGETNVMLTGYAPTAPYVWALSGSAGSVNYNPVMHLFAVNASPDATGAAKLVISRSPPPVLHLQRAGRDIEISWSAACIGYQLERATLLNQNGNWMAASNFISVVDDQNTVTLSPGDDLSFFRLIQ